MTIEVLIGIGIVTGVLGIVAIVIKLAELSSKLDLLHIATNSLQEKLVSATREAGFAEGGKAERDKQELDRGNE